MYNYTLKISPQDDQIGIAKYMDEYPHLVFVDGNQMIVANIRDSKEIRLIENGRFQHTETHYIPVMIHTPFMYSDLGSRSEIVRNHVIENYETPPFGTYTKGLISHLYKHLMKNPAYKPIFYSLIAIVVIITILLLYLYLR